MTITVLIVEDNDGDALIIEELFSDDDVGGPVQMERATSIADARALLTRGLDPDCALLDLGLPDAVGIEAVGALTSLAPELPIVVLTGSNDPEQATAALRAGAQDYLVKGPDLDEEITRRAIRYAIDRSAQLHALRASRRELRDFAHRVAHDLKTPMSVVLGSLELLQQARPDDDDVIFAMLERSSRRLVEMIDRLLEYADTAGSDEMLATVDLEAVLDWATAMLDSALDDVDLVVESPLPQVRANEVGLRHVFLNLLVNAIKYRDPARRTTITIAVERSEPGRVSVAVTDNGLGIAAQHRAFVFDAGYRVDSDEPGTGLGLATVQRTMMLIGGGVTVGSGPNHVGTTFLLDLPAADPVSS